MKANLQNLMMVVVLLCLGQTTAQTIYVNQAATGNNDGSSWANAYTSLVVALDRFRTDGIPNREMWVAAGTYKPGNNRTDTFEIRRDGLTIYGGFSGTETQVSDRVFGANETILSGDVLGNDSGVVSYTETTRNDNNYHIMNVTRFGGNLTLDGLTFYGGHANSSSAGDGGAITKYVGILNLTINACKFIDNVALDRGGAVMASQSNNNSILTIDNSIFKNNLSRNGGGLFVDQTATVITDVNMRNCLFYSNKTEDATNTAQAGSSAYIGLRSGNVNLVNNTFADNEDIGTLLPQNERTTLVVFQDGNNRVDLRVRNTILWNNRTTNGSIANGIGFAGNLNPVINILNSVENNNFSNMPTNSGNTVSNTNAFDPLFNNPVNEDFTLAPGSPSRDTGINGSVSLTVDLANNPRIINNTVDKGCYEAAVAPPGIKYVDVNATGSNNGSSWANAFNRLTEALAVAVQGTEIWIAGGNYYPSSVGDQNASFVVNDRDVKIYGGFAGTETQLSDRVFGANETILSGDLNNDDDNNISYINTTRSSDNSRQVMGITSAAENVLIDGITITGGHSGLTDGGGLVKNEQVRVLTVSNCTFYRNISRNTGGAISLKLTRTGSNISIENCAFIENFSRNGAAIFIGEQIVSNTAQSLVATVNVSNCLFEKNIVEDIPGVANARHGSSIYASTRNSDTFDLMFANNTHINNVDAGTIYGQSERATVGLFYEGGTSDITVSNSIFWNNYNDASSTSIANGVSPIIVSGSATNQLTIQHGIDNNNFSNIITGANTTLTNNNNQDPLFTDLANRDYTLSATSPAVDSGLNSAVVGSSDISGNSRIVNNTVDRGAYEFQGTTPCVVNIPDANFKAILVGDTNINTNGNTEIECSEASVYNGSIFVQGIPNADLTGLEAFTSLTRFTVNSSGVSSLDVSSNTALEFLRCAGNSVTSLDLSQNIALKEIECFSNSQLTNINLPISSSLEILNIRSNLLANIDLSGNPDLRILNINDNQFSSIDLTQNTNLESLEAGSNQFSALDVTQNINLNNLTVQNNQLTGLNLSQNSNLNILAVDNNSITSLDISQNPVLVSLGCPGNQLTAIDVSQNLDLIFIQIDNNSISGSLDLRQHSSLEYLRFRNNQLEGLDVRNGNNTAFIEFITTGNPNLSCISVDDVNYSNANWSGGIDSNTIFSTNCSTLSIADEVKDTVAIYPNPTSANVTIQSLNNQNIEEIVIYNLLGAAIKRTKDTSFSLSAYSAGTYIVKIVLKDGSNIFEQLIKK